MVDLLDLQDRDVIEEIRNNLKSHHFDIEFGSSNISHHEGLIYFLQQFTTNIEYLKVWFIKWSDDDVKRFFQSLQRQSKIDKLEIWMYESSIASVDDVISIIPQLTNKLTLEFEVVDDDVKREFCVKLKEEITKIDSTKIQSQKLDVEVVEDIGRLTILLHVVINRGEVVRIIKSKY